MGATVASRAVRVSACPRVFNRRPVRSPVSVVTGVRTTAMMASVSSPPILFLDIDGVLNRTATAPQINLEQDKMDRLRDILDSSGAEVVLSTYWRAFEEYISYTFSRMGAQGERVVGRTPGSPHLQDSVAHDDAVKTTRIVEITAYMETRFGSDRAAWPSFAIVDDKAVVPEGHPWRGRFVRTEHHVGLTADAADELVAALALDLEVAELETA